MTATAPPDLRNLREVRNLLADSSRAPGIFGVSRKEGASDLGVAKRLRTLRTLRTPPTLCALARAGVTRRPNSPLPDAAPALIEAWSV